MDSARFLSASRDPPPLLGCLGEPPRHTGIRAFARMQGELFMPPKLQPRATRLRRCDQELPSSQSCTARALTGLPSFAAVLRDLRSCVRAVARETGFFFELAAMQLSQPNQALFCTINSRRGWCLLCTAAGRERDSGLVSALNRCTCDCTYARLVLKRLQTNATAVTLTVVHLQNKLNHSCS